MFDLLNKALLEEGKAKEQDMNKVINTIILENSRYKFKKVRDGWNLPMITTKINGKIVDICINVKDMDKVIFYVASKELDTFHTTVDKVPEVLAGIKNGIRFISVYGQ